MLGVNTLYRLFCFLKLFPMVGKGLIPSLDHRLSSLSPPLHSESLLSECTNLPHGSDGSYSVSLDLLFLSFSPKGPELEERTKEERWVQYQKCMGHLTLYTHIALGSKGLKLFCECRGLMTNRTQGVKWVCECRGLMT